MKLIYIVLIVVGIFILLVLAGLAVVNFSADDLLDRFNQTAKRETSITPINFANLISNKYFRGSISIKFTSQMLGDCFNANGTLFLCSKYAHLNHLAGLSICAHELGHAFQFYYQKDKMKKYLRKIRLIKFFSKLITPLMLVAIALLIFDKIIISIAVASVALLIFILALCVKLSTIKIEKEASLKAIDILKENTSLTESELKIVSDFLNSAKLTYIADLLKSMLKWTGFTKK